MHSLKRIISLCLITPFLFSLFRSSVSAVSEAEDFKTIFGNNSVYRAIEYLGIEYNKSGEPKVNGIKYVSPGAKGTEIIPDSSTITGYAPNINAFRSRGMVCAGFVTYYLTNYLHNIEGRNMTDFKKEMVAHQETSGHSYQAVVFWANFLAKKASSGDGSVSRIYAQGSSADNAKVPLSVCETLLPGDIIIVGQQDMPHSHIAVYIGTHEGAYYIAHQPGPTGPIITSLTRYLEDGSYTKTHVTGIYRVTAVNNEISYVEDNEQAGIVIDISALPPATPASPKHPAMNKIWQVPYDARFTVACRHHYIYE